MAAHLRHQNRDKITPGPDFYAAYVAPHIYAPENFHIIQGGLTTPKQPNKALLEKKRRVQAVV